MISVIDRRRLPGSLFWWVALLAVVSHLGCRSMQRDKVVIYLAGDSTMADYADNYDEGKDYFETRFPMTGWGQVFQEVIDTSNLREIAVLGDAAEVRVDCRARGGRSTRTFFQEGRWRRIYDDLRPGDIVLIQFGHNDASVQKTERYVNIEGYKEFLRLFVMQTRQKGAVPIILTPVCRNYPWQSGHLENVHGEYPAAARDVAIEAGAFFIDLNQLSMEAFSAKGEAYVTENYFMNIPPGEYPAYPEGLDDNTHFQPEGAKAVAKIVVSGMKRL